MTSHICIDSLAKSAQQGWIQGGAKIGPGGGGGVSFSKELLLQTGRLQQQT